MNLVVFGAGGFSKEVADLIDALGHRAVAFVSDGESGTHSTTGMPIVPSIEAVEVPYDGYVIAIGNGTVRRGMVARLPRELLAPTLIHPRACVSEHASIGRGSIVMQNCVINASATVGEFTIANVGTCVAHDCVVGSYTHLAPASQLGGGSCVGDEVLLGMSSALLPCTSVGDRTTVGAGSVVIKNVGSDRRVAGIPARSLEL